MKLLRFTRIDIRKLKGYNRIGNYMKKFEDLLLITDISNLTGKEQVDIVGELFDLSFDNNSISGISKAFDLIGQIQIEELSAPLQTLLYYDIANGYGYLRKLKYFNTPDSWNFEMEEISHEVFHLRKAIASLGFEEIDDLRKCQIYTNLGNTFSFIGRFIEAQEYWRKALNIFPNFPMALANSGHGLMFYSNQIFDNSHKLYFINYGYHKIKEALHFKEYLEGDAANQFHKMKSYMDATYDVKILSEQFNLNSFEFGDNEKLNNYRYWCLENYLYINPLNDLGASKFASHDCLNLPSLILETKAPPTYFTLYNQLKQEFATARYFYYKSVVFQDPHFSDEDVVIVDTMESALFSYNLELAKSAFRNTYSILDKIAYFLNDYLKLGNNYNRVNFRSVWFKKDNKTLHEHFQNSQNWALRGLFWLSKDFFIKEHDEVLDPDSKQIAELRNSIEHKGLKIMYDTYLYSNFFNADKEIIFIINRDDFESKTLRLLKTVRAAIMYLAFIINYEEGQKESNGLPTLPMNLREVPIYMKF